MQLLDAMSNHPIAAGFISLLAFLSSYVIKPIMLNINDVHIPPIVMESLQSLAWVVAIVAGSISIYGFIRNRIKKKGTG